VADDGGAKEERNARIGEGRIYRFLAGREETCRAEKKGGMADSHLREETMKGEGETPWEKGILILGHKRGGVSYRLGGRKSIAILLLRKIPEMLLRGGKRERFTKRKGQGGEILFCGGKGGGSKKKGGGNGRSMGLRRNGKETRCWWSIQACRRGSCCHLSESD